jgi:hypothetical protein
MLMKFLFESFLKQTRSKNTLILNQNSRSLQTTKLIKNDNKPVKQQQPEQKLKEEKIDFWTYYHEHYGKHKTRSQFQEFKMRDLANLSIAAVFGIGVYLFIRNNSFKKKIEEKYEWIEAHANKYFKHRLFKCKGFVFPEFLAKDLENYKNFKLRKDDVFVVSFPKSGKDISP